LLVSGNNTVSGPTPQSIAIDPSATSPNIRFCTYTDNGSASGPYIVTLTATGPGGSVSQTIDNVPIYFP
jgi:hypothetical protein